MSTRRVSVDWLFMAIVAVIALALLFDFTNGFHDAANSVATVVATRAMPARWAPWFSAFFNFVAFFVVGTAVAHTLGQGGKHDAEGVAGGFSPPPPPGPPEHPPPGTSPFAPRPPPP